MLNQTSKSFNANFNPENIYQKSIRKAITKYRYQKAVAKISEKHLPSKTDFSTFLQLDCYKFWLELCETLI